MRKILRMDEIFNFIGFKPWGKAFDIVTLQNWALFSAASVLSNSLTLKDDFKEVENFINVNLAMLLGKLAA